MKRRSRKDIASDWAVRAIDTLFISRPERTSLGVIFGLVLYALKSLFQPFTEQITWIDLQSLNLWYCIPIGLFIMHIPTIFYNFSRKSELPSDIEAILEVIRESKKENVSLFEVRSLRLRLCELMLDKLEQKAIAEIMQTNSQKQNQATE